MDGPVSMPHGFTGVKTTNNAAHALATVGGSGLATASTFSNILAGGGVGAAALNLGGGLLNGAGGVVSLTEMLGKQIAIQHEMQAFSMQTNIAKTQHEARMSAVRNMRP